MANNIIYEVKRIQTAPLSVQKINGKNPFSCNVSFNPAKIGKLKIEFEVPYATKMDYFISFSDEKILDDGEINNTKQGANSISFEIDATASQIILVPFIFDNTFYVSRKVLLK